MYNGNKECNIEGKFINMKSLVGCFYVLHIHWTWLDQQLAGAGHETWDLTDMLVLPASGMSLSEVWLSEYGALAVTLDSAT